MEAARTVIKLTYLNVTPCDIENTAAGVGQSVLVPVNVRTSASELCANVGFGPLADVDECPERADIVEKVGIAVEQKS